MKSHFLVERCELQSGAKFVLCLICLQGASLCDKPAGANARRMQLCAGDTLNYHALYSTVKTTMHGL